MQKITAIIPTYNEAHNIAEAIDCVKFANEILVYDSFSTDNTVTIAQSKGARVVQHTCECLSAQKNRAINDAKHEWIILLDADERIPQPLAEEMIKTVKNPGKFDSFWIFRNNYFMGRNLKKSGIQNDKCIRLFKRDTCRYNNKWVHEEIESQGYTGQLKHRINHNTYTTLNAFIEKMNRYADWQAMDYDKRTGTITAYHLLLKPFFRFFKHYLWGLGFSDGFAGFVFACTQAYAVQMRYIKLKLLRNNIK